MRQLRDGYRGVRLLVEINTDLLLFAATLALALGLVSYITTL